MALDLGITFPQGTDENVKVSGNDQSAGFLLSKIVAGAGITLNELNDGGAETLEIVSAGGGGGDLLAANNLSDVASASTSYNNIKQQGTKTFIGAWEGATVAETNTGTDITKIVTVDGLAGSQLATDVSANNSKVSNATHTGDVTGSGALTLDKTSVTGQSTVTPVNGDFVLISDTSDTGNLKKVDTQLFLNNLAVIDIPLQGNRKVNGISLFSLTFENLTGFISEGPIRIGPGLITPDTALDINSATGALVVPRMTEAARDAFSVPLDGMIIYNTTQGWFEFYELGAWASGSGLS